MKRTCSEMTKTNKVAKLVPRCASVKRSCPCGPAHAEAASTCQTANRAGKASSWHKHALISTSQAQRLWCAGMVFGWEATHKHHRQWCANSGIAAPRFWLDVTPPSVISHFLRDFRTNGAAVAGVPQLGLHLNIIPWETSSNEGSDEVRSEQNTCSELVCSTSAVCLSGGMPDCRESPCAQ